MTELQNVVNSGKMDCQNLDPEQFAALLKNVKPIAITNTEHANFTFDISLENGSRVSIEIGKDSIPPELYFTLWK